MAVTDRNPSLEDLRPRLAVLGVLDEYEQFARHYREWRCGGTRGAEGELQSVSPTPKYLGQEIDLYPENGGRIFMFRHLSAYWTAVCFILGSLLFTCNAGCCLFKLSNRSMRTWPNFIGGLYFCVGAYASYFQLINIHYKQDGDLVFIAWPEHWKVIRGRTAVMSRMGTMAYFIGAVLFQVGATLEVIPAMEEIFEESPASKYILCAVPNMLGCVGFVLGGVCEIVHLRMYQCGAAAGDDPDHELDHQAATWRDTVWWAAVANNIAAILFTVGCVPPLIFHPNAVVTDATFFVGSILFTLSSCALVLMWRSNDFGLTLLKQLNFYNVFHAMKVRRTDSGGHSLHFQMNPDAVEELLPRGEANEEQGLSWRGIGFIFIGCLLQFVVVVRAILHVSSYGQDDIAPSVFENAIIISVVFLVLMLQSVTLKVPGLQPYRCAMFYARGVFTVWFLLDFYLVIRHVILSTSAGDS